MEHITDTERGLNISYIRKLAKALNNNDLETFFDTLRIFFANIPYEITVKNEKYYQSLFYAIHSLLGFQLEAEVALQQIIDKQYAQKYQSDNKQIHLVGVAFDVKSRSIGEYQVRANYL